MAKTYYNYAERQADAFVDWGKIGRDLTTMLAEQNKIREDKKAALDKASSEFGQVLSNAPQGENKELNQWALEYASDAQQARLLQDKLLKSGRLSVKDYTVMRQNINDGTTQLFNLIKTYQERQKIVMDRFRKNESSKLELYQWQQAEEFGDFSKSKPYINPTDFRVNLGQKVKKVVDGKEVDVMDPYPDKYATVNSVLNRINTNYDRYDITKGVKALVDTFGSEISVVQELATLYKTGSIRETLDVTKKSNLPADAQGIIMKFEDVETKLLQTILQDKFKAASILTDSIGIASNGKEYDFTQSETEAKNNPNLIYLKTDPRGGTVPVLSEEQNKVALDRLRLEARVQYDKKDEFRETPKLEPKPVTPRTPRTPTGKELDIAKLKKQAEVIGKNLAYVLTGDAVKARQGAQYFQSVEGISALELLPTGINLIKGSNALPYTFTEGGVEATPEDVALSIVGGITQGTDLDQQIIIDAFNKNKLSNRLTKQNLGRVGKTKTDYSTEFSEFNKTKIPTLIKEDSPIATRNALKKEYGKFGYKFEAIVGNAMNIGTDKIRIIPPVGDPVEFVIDEPEEVNNDIINFLNANKDNNLIRQSGVFEKRLQTQPTATPAPKPKVQTTVTGGTPR